MHYVLKWGRFNPLITDDPKELEAFLAGLLLGTRSQGGFLVGMQEARDSARAMVGVLLERPEMFGEPVCRRIPGWRDVEIWTREGGIPA